MRRAPLLVGGLLIAVACSKAEEKTPAAAAGARDAGEPGEQARRAFVSADNPVVKAEADELTIDFEQT